MIFLKRTIAISCLMMLLSICSFSQKGGTDSLLQVLRKMERNRDYQKGTAYLDLLNQIAWRYMVNFNDSSLIFAQKSDSLCIKWNYPKGRVDALRLIGIHERGKGDNTIAMNTFLEGLTIAQRIYYAEGEGKMYRQIGIIYVNQGRYKEALHILRKALKIVEQTPDVLEHLAVAIAIGNAYYDWGKPDSALYYNNTALKMATAVNNKTAESIVLNNNANIYREQGNLMQALEDYYKAIRIDEERGDMDGVTAELINISEVLITQRNYQKAQENLLKGLKINEATGDKRTRTFLLAALAKVYSKQNDFDLAQKFYNEALEIHKNLDEPAGLSEILIDLGDLYQLQKRHSEALKTYERSLKITENTGQLKAMCAANIGLGGTLISLKKNERAKSVVQKGLQLALEIKNKEYIRDANELLSSLYEAGGNKNLALYHFKQFKLYADSINNIEANTKSTMLTAQYEYEKKEALLKADQRQREIEFKKEVAQQKLTIMASVVAVVSLGVFLGIMTISRKKIQTAYVKLEEANTEILLSKERIQEQSNRLEEANNTKDKLFSIIGHDLRSPLNTLNGLLMLASKQGLTPDELQELFRKLNRSFVHTSETMENLLEWAHSQMKGFHNKPAYINPNQLVQKVCDLFLEPAAAKNINISCSVDDDLLIFADENQLKLVLRNLINNAIKFTPNGGLINIQAKQKDDFVEISVVDTGVGLQPDQIERLFKISSHFSTQGTNGEKGNGLGLMLCQEMTEQNGGKIQAASDGKSGSQFTLLLPGIRHKKSNS